MEGKYGQPRRGEMAQLPMLETALAFSLPGQWTAIDVNTVDCDPATGELTLPWNVMGLPFNEVIVTYTAGLALIGDDVKSACAQIVRNAQATAGIERQPDADGHACRCSIFRVRCWMRRCRCGCVRMSRTGWGER